MALFGNSEFDAGTNMYYRAVAAEPPGDASSALTKMLGASKTTKEYGDVFYKAEQVGKKDIQKNVLEAWKKKARTKSEATDIYYKANSIGATDIAAWASEAMETLPSMAFG